ncbi:MAG: hypothetical protein HYS40_08045 [Gemmatimonadetes bacterium]|nr:hypothetical protein [Gemmatimonadota bacterium]
MTSINLTPFGFTPTESVVYTTLLRLGPSTGYAVAQAARLARANAYGALEGLVSRGAAAKTAGRPARYRPVDPQALIVQLATDQGEALDRLARSLRDASQPTEPSTREVSGARAVANLILQLVARAERNVEGVLAAELWRPTVPAWRRAAARAALGLRIAGDAGDTEGLAAGAVEAGTPTILVIDGNQSVVASGAGEAVTAIWSSHPVIVTVARTALRSLS